MYNPLSGAPSARAQCARTIREWLEASLSGSQSDPLWAQRFWNNVYSLEASGALEYEVRELLMAQGYLGAATRTAPRDDLVAALKALEAPAPLQMGPLPGGAVGSASVDSTSRWATQLPADYKRAGPEIYRNLRHQGAAGAREWLQQSFSGFRQGGEWQSLWDAACQVDFALGEAKTEEETFLLLGTSDLLEINLRSLAAYLYQRRTGDRVGAMEMRAVVAPGNADIAPTWLVSDSTAHSKQEYQRSERVAGELKRRASSTAGQKGKDQKGKGRGKEGKTDP